MLSNRETNSDLHYSEENQDDENKDIEENVDSKRRKLFRHRLSERKLPAFLKKTRIINTKIVSEIEETKNKIIKNLKNIKVFNLESKKFSNKHILQYKGEEENNKFNIYKYIDERKDIRDKILLYNNNLDSDVLHIIEYLSLDPNKRTRLEHKYIKNYLMKTSLMQSLLNLNENKKNINKIINKICLNLKYKFFYAGKTIYEINSIPDNYYYIIEGKVQAFKPEKISIRMTGFEYFKYIMRLKRDNENYLIDLILKNQTNFVIHKSDLPILNYIFFIIIFKEFCNNVNFRFYFMYELEDNNFSYESPLDKMFILCFCDKEKILKDINLNQNYFEGKSPMRELEKQIKKNIPAIPDNLIKYYSSMALNKKLFDITLFKYKTIVELKKGSFFGESANKKHSLREYTLKTIEDCHLSYLEIEIYDSFLKKEKEKITEQMIDYLYNKFFFNQINEKEFKNQFFRSFVFEVKEFGHKLTEQNQKMNYIYFIKEGEISINCYFSINLFIENFLKVLRANNNLKYNDQFIELINEFENFLKQNNKNNFNKLNFISLFIAISRSIIGLDSYFFGFHNYLYNAVVTSSIVKYFKIEIKYLIRIFKEFYYIKEIAQNEATQKILLIIDRFIKSLKLKINKKKNYILSNNKSNLNNIKVQKNKDENNKINIYDYNEDSSINNIKRLNKCIINYKNNINEKKIFENNSYQSLKNQKSSFEKKIFNNNKKNKLYSLSPKIRKNRNLGNFLDYYDFSKIRNKLKKISIKNELLLVNMLHKNIANNLLFSRLKNNKELLNSKSNNNMLNNNSKIKKINVKLKPIIDNENKALINNLKFNFKTKISLNNSKNNLTNSNSIIKTYRSIKTNTIDINNNNEVEIDDAIGEEEIFTVKNIYLEENKNGNMNDLFKKNLGSN